MNSRDRNNIFYIGSLLIGTTSIYFVHLFGDLGYCCLLIAFVLLALAFALKYQFVPWQLIIIMLISNYITGLVFLPGWGQLLPVELMLLFVYWGVIGLVSKLGIYISNKYNERKA